MRKICHITTIHPRFDTRIFKKECISLANKGFDVSLVIADGLSDQKINGVKIYDAGKFYGNRLRRFLYKTRLVYNKAVSLDADIYHFHDPDFIPFGLKLLKKGKIVIYDVHEDVPKQIYSKEYLPSFLHPVLEFLIRIYENFAAKRFSSIITVTSSINNRFLLLNHHTIQINNYAFLNELYSDTEWSLKKNRVAYIGGISEVRGITQLINALKFCNYSLDLAGEFENKKLLKSFLSNNCWSKVNYHGIVDRSKVKEILNESNVGIVTFLPLPNHIEAQPNKMFEYMSAGIPVIASNFPLWKEIIESNNCGICVDPLNSKEIGETINRLISNQRESRIMGENGRKAIIEKYNWEHEEEKLVSLYNTL